MTSKHDAREELARMAAQFKARGGKVTKVEEGTTAALDREDRSKDRVVYNSYVRGYVRVNADGEPC